MYIIKLDVKYDILKINKTFKEYLKLLNRLYDITWFGSVYAFHKPQTCSTISNIPYNLIFVAKFNDSSILITIISCDYLNLSIRLEYSNQIKLL